MSPMGAEPVLWVNDGLVPAGRGRLDPRDRGFTLGDGLFETMRAGGGGVPWVDRHLVRLRDGAASIGLPLPWTDGELTDAVVRTLAANGLADGVVRLTVSRGTPARRGLLPEDDAKPFLVVHAEPFAGYPPTLYARGLRAITSQTRRNERSPLAGLKTLNYLDNVLARREAAAHGADEALLRNTRGYLACASAANLFLVHGRTLVTPSIRSGALPGTTRAFVLSELTPRLGLGAVERMVRAGELFAADEAFLTNALIGVLPLTVVDGRPVGSGQPGPVTTELGAALSESWSLLVSRGAAEPGQSV